MSPRKTVKITTWPDPLIQERLEDMGFFYDGEFRTWIHFCEEDELQALAEWLNRHRLAHAVLPAKGRGETRKHACLSQQLVLKNGGNATTCALCGTTNVPCRQWIEGDDTDSTDYANAARFYLCGTCVQTRMQPHPRLYSPSEEQL